MNDLPDTDYWNAFRANSHGILSWQKLDVFWANLVQADRPWYVFELGGPAPEQSLTNRQLIEFLACATEFTKRRGQPEYCGCVYVDDMQAPRFIRIFDPKNMGSACGGSGNMIMPKWNLSRLKPESLPDADTPAANSNWISRILKRA